MQTTIVENLVEVEVESRELSDESKVYSVAVYGIGDNELAVGRVLRLDMTSEKEADKMACLLSVGLNDQNVSNISLD